MSSEVQVALGPDEAGGTRFELEHSAVPDPEFWTRYGPGATGIGWDLALLGLAVHLAGGRFDEADLTATPDGRRFVAGAGRAWGEAHRASGATVDEAEAAVRNTVEFYGG